MLAEALVFAIGFALALATPRFLRILKYYRALSHLPRPPLNGILENLVGFPLGMMKDKNVFQWVWADMLAELGPLVAARIFHKNVLMVADPEVTTAVLSRPQLFDKRIASYKMGTKALSRHNLVNLITSETDSLWRSINRSIGPCFTWDNLYKMFPTVQNVWIELRNSIMATVNSFQGDEQSDLRCFLDIDRFMTEANFETILRLGFRYSMDTIGKGPHTRGQKFLDAMADAFKVAFVMLSKQKAESRSLFRRKKSAALAKDEEENEIFIELWRLSEALVEHSKSIGLSPEDPEIGGHLLSAVDPNSGKPLTDEKLAAEITILLIAGHETSSHTTSMALGLLAMNHEALRKVEAELDGLGLLATPSNPHPRVPSFDDLDKLKYTWQAAKEASRLFPAVYFLPRQAMKDTTVCGLPVAKGTIFVCCVGALQRSVQLWEDPLKYMPERWDDLDECEFVANANKVELENNIESGDAIYNKGLLHAASTKRKQNRDERVTYAKRFSSFSQGPRSCAGQNLAKINLLMGIATVIGNFKMELIPTIKSQRDLDRMTVIRFTMQIQHEEFRMKLTPRIMPIAS